jgi:hypothetical protein
MGSYAEIDPEIERWAEKRSLMLNSSPWNGGESRCVWLSSEAGECFEIWIEPPVDGVVRLHAAGVESRRDDDPPHDWTVPVEQTGAALERAYELVLEWMRPSTRYHRPRQRS